MTLAAFQEQFSFKFLPKTVIRKFWRSQCARQRVPDRWPHTQEKHEDQKSLFLSSVQSIPDSSIYPCGPRDLLRSRCQLIHLYNNLTAVERGLIY